MKILQNIKSVRSVLVLWYSFVLLSAFAIFSVSVYAYLEHLLEQRLDNSLVDDVEWITRLLEIETKKGPAKELPEEIQDVIARHFSLSLQNFVVLLSSPDREQILYESDNRLDRILLQTAIPLGRTVLQEINDEQSGLMRVGAHRTPNYLIQVASTRESINQVLDHLLSILGVLAPVMLFVSVSGGWLLAGIILKPISDISHMAKRITAENLGERIPERKVKDELGELIETINATIARLQTSFTEIRQFSMNVAHELKTPLTIMKGESELALTRNPSGDETQQLILSFLEETTRMSRIVDDLLTLAKADAGQAMLETHPVNFTRTINELFEDAQILAEPRNLKVELLQNDEAMINGDDARLRQLFRAILTNAVQYTDKGGTIRIQSLKSGGMVEVSVEDTGIGIAPEHLERIFERFYRVDQARTRTRGGSGLGLSIAKWIAESHGGWISVQSTLARGSRFVVQLPLRISNK